MKEIILEKDTEETIQLSNVSQSKPIFAKKDGKLCGMVVNEDSHGWIVRIGGKFGVSGHHATLEECLNSCKTKYTFYVV